MELALGLSSWIVQDGNYGDFSCGERIEVAVEFGFEGSPTLADAPPGATRVEGSTYDITGRVVVVAADVWVLDVGILVFNEAPPPQGVAVGDTVTGLAYLGVDPFFYFERLFQRPTMPPMIYSWIVKRIEMQTAPFIERDRLRFRDPTRLGWADAIKTNAWVDDGGYAEYVLRCELLDLPPQRKSLTAT